MKLYKVLNEDGSCYNGGVGRWSLPVQNDDGSWTPGEWMPPIEGELIPCENGYHLCTIEQLFEWFGPAIFEAEYRGECIDAGDKTVVREARLLRKTPWDERVARLFAADCAERVLHIYEASYPDDNRVRHCIEVARLFANGQATEDELAAAWAAAWAAWDAAQAAEREWQVGRLTEYLEGQ